MDEWLRVREHLRANRYRLAAEAASRYPDIPTLAGTPLLTRPEWVPGRPVPLADLAIALVPTPPAPTLPAGPVPAGYPRYSAAMAALDAPAVFENRPTYRLLSASLLDRRLEFGHGTYFTGIDVGEAAAHELAAGGPTPLRDAVGDPTVLRGRPANLAISALTIRAGARRTFFLHWRDPAKVGHAGGLYQVLPVGVFQASGPSPEDFSLWNFMLREYAEELLGEPERTAVDYASWPFAARMSAALRDGLIRAHCLGLGVDPLTFATDLLVSVVIDAPVFDDLFGTVVAVNEEGSVSEQPFTAETIENLPMQAAGAALVHRALHLLAED
ncbi:hypothetical protein [Actinophytocola sp.]|uniref:hypothetical protein n=1 Tax=Actinophytocola sp. TaxID=1872138 RepID=UPI002EDA74F9